MGFSDWLSKMLATAPPPAGIPVLPLRTAIQGALLDELKSTLADTNIRACLRVIRAGESTQDDSAYRWLYGSTSAHPLLFNSSADHPRQAFQSHWGWTSAAGAYQAMCAVPGKVKTDTWGDFIRDVGPMDFSMSSQDLFAVWGIRRRNAVRDVIAGDLVIALTKIGREWASMPGSPYGQPTMSLNRAGSIFAQYGGHIRSST